MPGFLPLRPAGLTAAAALAPRTDGKVVVLEREPEAGGIPRHSDHAGYGTRDLRRFMRGPAYARYLAEHARSAGAEILLHTTVTGWDADGSLEVTSPHGRRTLSAAAVILATGARERPRAARLVAGDRPQGVYTTGQLQNLVHLQHRSPGRRAVVVGAELVSWSAVLTLRHAGCETVLMTSLLGQAESYGLLSAAAPIAMRTRLATRTRVTRIVGRRRVEGVEVEQVDTRARRVIDCDTVVFTGDWIPDHEIARLRGLAIDPRSKAPLVDSALRTSQQGIFAIGNLVHPVDTADVAALDGAHVVAGVADWLRGSRPAQHAVRLTAAEPLRWIAPGLLRRDDPAPARHRLLAWSDDWVRRPEVRVLQEGREVGRQRLLWPAAPGRIFRIPSGILRQINWDLDRATLTIGWGTRGT